MSECALLPRRVHGRRENFIDRLLAGEPPQVDIVLELASGEVAGIEIKTAAGIQPKDFAGIRYLRDKLGTNFKVGVVLYTGKRTLPFGDRLTAVPLCGLWAGEGVDLG